MSGLWQQKQIVGGLHWIENHLALKAAMDKILSKVKNTCY